MLRFKILKIVVVAACVPIARITSQKISKKIYEKVGGGITEEPNDEEWIKMKKSNERSLFISTLAFYISISGLILKLLMDT